MPTQADVPKRIYLVFTKERFSFHSILLEIYLLVHVLSMSF